jgi:type I restriction enzyme S subunit
MTANFTRRAFAVQFRDLRLWSVGSHFDVGWQWPKELIHPLSVVLKRRSVEVDRKQHDIDALKLITLHFDGEIEPRDLRGTKEFKGKLYFADAGDMVYSKIDVRNGAIGIVPEGLTRVAVSSEYPVYEVRSEVALPQYVKLLFRTNYFRKVINSLISGASGRKRVQPSQIEEIEVPIPPLRVQKAIVTRWQKAQDEIQLRWNELNEKEGNMWKVVYENLGIVEHAVKSRQQIKYMALEWKELERWSVNYLVRAKQGLIGFTKSLYPIVTLSRCIEDTMNGYCIKPVPTPTEHRMLKLNALTPAGLNLGETKYVIVTDKIARNFSIRKGDLLICRSVGSYSHIAKCAIAKTDEPDILFPDIIIRVRFNDMILPDYAREVIQTPLGRSYFQSNARTAVGMWKIGAEDINNFPIPLPSLTVQSRIIKNIEKMRAEINKERNKAERQAREIEAEVEELILGTKQL